MLKHVHKKHKENIFSDEDQITVGLKILSWLRSSEFKTKTKKYLEKI